MRWLRGLVTLMVAAGVAGCWEANHRPADAGVADAAASDARPAGEIPPGQLGLFGGGGGAGTTGVPGAARARVTVDQTCTGRSGGAGSRTIEWGLLPSVKVR